MDYNNYMAISDGGGAFLDLEAGLANAAEFFKI
jgi:hypothetical protein